MTESIHGQSSSASQIMICSPMMTLSLASFFRSYDTWQLAVGIDCHAHFIWRTATCSQFFRRTRILFGNRHPFALHETAVLWLEAERVNDFETAGV